MINEWSCHICGETRADRNISVRSHDKSEECGLQPGTFVEKIRYCNDNYDCVEQSKTFSHHKKEEIIDIVKNNVEKVNEMADKAIKDHNRKKNEFDEGMKKVGIFFLYFIAISLLGSLISSISGDETFMEHLFTPWLVPVRLILAFIIFKIR